MLLGTVVMLGGLTIECAGMIGMQYCRVGPCLKWQTLGGMVFCAGASILVLARSFS